MLSYPTQTLLQLNSFLACHNFWCLLITLAKSLDPDQDWWNFSTDLDLSHLTLWESSWKKCLKGFILKKVGKWIMQLNMLFDDIKNQLKSILTLIWLPFLYWKCGLFFTPAVYNQMFVRLVFFIEINNMNPDQTATKRRTFRSEFILFAITAS